MSGLFKAWNSINLVFRIVCGLIIGTALGVMVPNSLSVVLLFGTLFVGALKSIAPILVFVLVISALCRKSSNGVGSRFKTVIGYYTVSTFAAALISVVASFLFPVSLQLTDTVKQAAPAGVSEVLITLMKNAVSNPVGSLVNANYIGILVWAIIIGLALKEYASEPTANMMGEVAEAIGQTVRWVISFAPFGIMGLVYDSVSTSGMSIFTDYGKLLLVLVGSMFIMALVLNPLIVALSLKQNPYPLVFRCIRDSGLTAFFTRSSAANIPINMNLCEKLGLNRDHYSVSIPLGATINMDGAAVTITVMTLAAANTLGIAVDFPSAVILSVLATLGACGASGVAGGSLLLIPMACSLFGISNDIAMQVVAVGFIIGVIQDSVETALNSSTDVLYTATAEFKERIDKGEEIDLAEIAAR